MKLRFFPLGSNTFRIEDVSNTLSLKEIQMENYSGMTKEELDQKASELEAVRKHHNELLNQKAKEIADKRQELQALEKQFEDLLPDFWTKCKELSNVNLLLEDMKPKKENKQQGNKKNVQPPHDPG